MNFKDRTDRQLDYLEGFIKKCAAYKVDPEDLVKKAQSTTFNPKYIPRDTEGLVGRGNKTMWDQQNLGGWFTSPGKNIINDLGRALGSGYNRLKQLGSNARGQEAQLEALDYATAARRNIRRGLPAPKALEEPSIFNWAGQSGREQGFNTNEAISKYLKDYKNVMKANKGQEPGSSLYVPGSKYDPNKSRNYGLPPRTVKKTQLVLPPTPKEQNLNKSLPVVQPD